LSTIAERQEKFHGGAGLGDGHRRRGRLSPGFSRKAQGPNRPMQSSRKNPGLPGMRLAASGREIIVRAMKLSALLAALSLPMLAFAQSQAPAPAAPSPSGAAPSVASGAASGSAAGKSAPAAAKKDDTKAAATKKAPATKKEEPPAVVEGVAIARAKGGFIGLRVVNSNFVLTFYDAKKKKVAPDVTRASLRWPVKYQPGDERAVLNLSGNLLTSSKVVKPPLVFKVFIGLYAEGSDQAVESYTVDYHGE
jgi:hypothetical protein